MEVVTCLHGFSQRGRSWRELARLTAGDRRWLTPDLDATSLEQAVSEVLDLWELEGVRRSHLVGYSQGGRVALYLASQHPERLRTLTVISAHAGLEGEARAARLKQDLELADRIEREGTGWFAEYWASQPLFAGLSRRDGDFLRRLDEDRRSHLPGRLAAVLRGLGAGATPPFWDRLAAIQVPTLVLAGARDERYAGLARRLGAAIPGSRVEILPAAGHAVHLEQPAAAAEQLRSHLSSR